MSNTPGNKITKKLREINKSDVNLQLTSLNGRLEPDLDILAKNENEKLVNKKIVNNKPSQFGPILGVDFHMIKK
jgi:hypothetical protein